MHEYRIMPISKLMLKVNPNTSEVDLFVAAKMMEMCEIKPVSGAEPVAKSLILGVGQSPVACALGSRNFGHNVMGVVFHVHASALHQQNFLRNKLRSRARFVLSTVDALNLAVPVPYWDYVFVLPYVTWGEVESFVLNRVQKNAKIVVAQRLPVDVEGLEHAYFRTTQAGYCIETEDSEGAEYVVFKVR